MSFIGTHVRLSRNGASHIAYWLTWPPAASLKRPKPNSSTRPRRLADNLAYHASGSSPMSRLYPFYGDLADNKIRFTSGSTEPQCALSDSSNTRLSPWRLVKLCFSLFWRHANPSRQEPFFPASCRQPQLAFMASRLPPLRRLTDNCGRSSAAHTLPPMVVPPARPSQSQATLRLYVPWPQLDAISVVFKATVRSQPRLRKS